MSTMTIERRKKIENHIVKTYFTKHFGIEHGSNGWDIIHGSSDRDIPTVLANPNWDNCRVVIRWFIPDEASYINPECAKVAAYYDLVVVSGWFAASDSELDLSKANEKIEELDRCLNQANDIIDEWKSNTCCETPTEARKHIEELMQENASLQASVHNLEFTNNHLGDTIKKERAYVLELQKEIAAWQNATGRKTPEEAEKRIDGILDDLSKADDDVIDLGVEIKKLQDHIKASSRNMLWITSNGLLISESDKTVEALEAQVDKLNDEINDYVSHINELDARIKELSNDIFQWTSETGFKDPVICGHYIDLLKREGKTKSDLISNLAKKVANDEPLSKLVGFSSVEEIQDYLTNEAKCDTLHEAIHMMCKEMDRRQKKIDELRDDISGRSTVIESCKREIESLKAALRASNSIMLGELEQEIDEWQKATGCKLPSMAREKIEHYKRRLGNAVQAASCAAKHLDNITF